MFSSKQEHKEHERRCKQAKRVRCLQVLERSQTTELGRDRASQLVAVEVPVEFHKGQSER